MSGKYSITKSRLSWLKSNNVALEIMTKNGHLISGLVKKFDDESMLVDVKGEDNRNDFQTVFYGSIESFCNSVSQCGD
ncbi:hypothetical protein [Xenorhabdus bovienii]|uniref:hypothetical protein n=1 Tax=Xenorhabdus bovienii TaxID=40576 RepID=UPI003DA4F36F